MAEALIWTVKLCLALILFVFLNTLALFLFIMTQARVCAHFSILKHSKFENADFMHIEVNRQNIVKVSVLLILHLKTSTQSTDLFALSQDS